MRVNADLYRLFAVDKRWLIRDFGFEVYYYGVRSWFNAKPPLFNSPRSSDKQLRCEAQSRADM